MSTEKMKKSDISPIHLRITQEIKEILQNMAEEDRRDMTSQVEWLILQENKRRQQHTNAG